VIKQNESEVGDDMLLVQDVFLYFEYYVHRIRNQTLVNPLDSPLPI